MLWAAEKRSPLSPADAELLAEAARWAREYAVMIDALEQAEARYERVGDRGLAARAALSLCREHFIRNNLAEAGGWLGRAARLLEDEPECPAHGYLQWSVGRAAWAQEDFETALNYAREASAIGRRLGDSDLEALGLHDEGHVLIARGDVDAGRALIDEAAAMGGAARDPQITGMVYCGAIWAYRNMADWRRAGEWTDASLRWCERESLSGFPGLCRFHRAEVRRLRGDLNAAEQDALDAIDELMPANLIAAGWALTELGEIRRRRGERSGARDAFRRAQELGGLPQPGLALLLLDEGKPDAALASITDALGQMVGVGREDRASVLPAVVTIALAASQRNRAREALTELESWGKSFETSAALAAVAAARGEVQLAENDAEAAITSLREACLLWCEVEAPFEAARARLLTAAAMRMAGHESNATGEIETALGAFERLGASGEAERARSMLQATRRTRATRTLMFTDIVDSTRLVEVLGDEAWGSLLDWHNRTLRQCFGAASGREINHEGDGFFVSFADPGDAVDCAIAIQRTLAEHRREHGFAPQIRIGVHATEAVDVGDDYLGKGVHEAARVGAAADAGEILVTATVIDAVAGHSQVRNRRELKLKGLALPMAVANVEWG
ncbi:MAG: adenylate/guanylate cyclase domain-containing protein [Acidimicrobiia bacterium]|nr:adenylate/guanylate cyclase domain-containing protein [Acidimicrobiia bacterium]